MSTLGAFALVWHTHLPEARTAGNTAPGMAWTSEKIMEMKLPVMHIRNALNQDRSIIDIMPVWAAKSEVSLSSAFIMLERLPRPLVAKHGAEDEEDFEEEEFEELDDDEFEDEDEFDLEDEDEDEFDLEDDDFEDEDEFDDDDFEDEDEFDDDDLEDED